MVFLTQLKNQQKKISPRKLLKTVHRSSISNLETILGVKEGSAVIIRGDGFGEQKRSWGNGETAKIDFIVQRAWAYDRYHTKAGKYTYHNSLPAAEEEDKQSITHIANAIEAQFNRLGISKSK